MCRFKEVAEEAYSCNKLTMAVGRCASRRKRCARPPNTPPAITVGGINETMTRILRDFPQYSPRAISRPGGKLGAKAPWVVTLQNFVSDAEADAFIHSCEHEFFRSLA